MPQAAAGEAADATSSSITTGGGDGSRPGELGGEEPPAEGDITPDPATGPSCGGGRGFTLSPQQGPEEGWVEESIESRDPHERFDALYREHALAVLRYALRRTDASDAQDVLSDTFLVVWRRLEDVPAGPESLPWLYAVAGRVLSEHGRAARRRRRLERKLGGQPAEPAPDEGAEDLTVYAAVRTALNALPDRDREVLRLWAWEQLDGRQLALALECSANAAAIRLHRARRHLADALGGLPAANSALGQR